MNKYVVTEQAVINAPVGHVWDVISRTDRYAEWVAGAIEVTDHHGVATVGKTYTERNRTLGPLKTDSVWTVRERAVRASRRHRHRIRPAPGRDQRLRVPADPERGRPGDDRDDLPGRVRHRAGTAGGLAEPRPGAGDALRDAHLHDQPRQVAPFGELDDRPLTGRKTCHV